jgi:hypothetical protein
MPEKIGTEISIHAFPSWEVRASAIVIFTPYVAIGIQLLRFHSNIDPSLEAMLAPCQFTLCKIYAANILHCAAILK